MRCVFRLSVLAGIAVTATACATGLRRAPTPTPDRPAEQLSREIRDRHADLIDAVRLGDTVRIRRNLMPDARLVTPAGATLRGVDEISKAMLALRAGMSIETVRGTSASEMIRCHDGVLERMGEWSLSTMKPDSSIAFHRGHLAVQWVTRNDSLAASVIDMVAVSLPPSKTGCVSADASTSNARRFEVFATRAFLTPVSFRKSADHDLSKAGYSRALSQRPDAFPDGRPPSAAQIVGISGRLTERFWLTVALPREPEKSIIGRCNPTTYNYVMVARTRRPYAFTLDYRPSHRFTFGLGPARTSDDGMYREYDFEPRPPSQTGANCEASVVRTRYDSTAYERSSNGVAGNVTFQMPMSPHFSAVFRMQLWGFPTAPAPSTSRGMALDYRDLTATIGLGLTFNY